MEAANLPRRKRLQDPKGRRRPTRCSHSDYPLGQTQGGPATRPHLGLAGGPSPAGCGELCLDKLRFRVSDRTLAAQISTKVCTLAPAAPRPPAPPPLARSEHFLKCPLCTLGKGPFGKLAPPAPAGPVFRLAQVCLPCDPSSANSDHTLIST